jgi:RNA polymerase sigma-32 factor
LLTGPEALAARAAEAAVLARVPPLPDDEDHDHSALVPAARSVPATVERGLERVPALTRYYNELRQHPPISREEEHALALRWTEHGDVEAARKLALSNLRLVVKIAMEYRRAWTNTLDLIQEGNLGLLQAVQRFDPYAGTKLASYAAYWIRAYILKYLMDNIRLVKLGGTRAERKLFFRLGREKRELERQGFRPEPRLIAERLDLPEAEVVAMEQRLSGGEISLDAPVGDEEGSASFGDFVAAPAASAEAVVSGQNLRETFLKHVHAFATGLGPREQRILEARILADEPLTLQQIGDEMHLTRERVRQLEKQLVDDLREYLKTNVVDFEYYAPTDE